MLCVVGAFGFDDVVGGTVVVVVTPWPVAWNSGAGAVAVVGKMSVVVAASFVVWFPRTIGWVFVAAAGTAPSTIDPAAPAAAAPASLRISRRLWGAEWWTLPLPLPLGRPPASS